MYAGMNTPPFGGGLPPYATDFREFAAGVEISTNGWTKRTGDGGGVTGASASNLEATVQTNASSLSGRRVQIDHDQASHVYGVTYDAIPDTTTDCEVLALMQWTSDPTDFGGGAVMLRANSTVQDSYNACPGFGAPDINSPEQELFEINEVVGGYRRGSGGTGDGDETAQTVSSGTRYWIRQKATGTSIKAKMWAYGGVEPSSWSVSFADSTRSSGNVGLMVVNPSEPYYCEYFSVGLGSKTAPSPNG